MQTLNNGKFNCFDVGVSLVCERRMMHISIHFYWPRETGFASEERQTNTHEKGANP